MIIKSDSPEYFDRFPADYLRPLVEQGRANDSPTSVYTVGGDPTDPETPAFVVFALPPGGVLPRHSHDCHRFEVVIQGEMESEGVRLTVGDIMTAAPNEAYGPHVAGPEGCTVVEYFSAVRGAYQISWVKRDSTSFFEDQLAIGSTS